MRLGGGEVACRTIVRNLGKDVGCQNVTLWVPNIGTITSLREGFGEKSPLSCFCPLAYYSRDSQCITNC